MSSWLLKTLWDEIPVGVTSRLPKYLSTCTPGIKKPSNCLPSFISTLPLHGLLRWIESFGPASVCQAPHGCLLLAPLIPKGPSIGFFQFKYFNRALTSQAEAVKTSFRILWIFKEGLQTLRWSICACFQLTDHRSHHWSAIHFSIEKTFLQSWAALWWDLGVQKCLFPSLSERAVYPSQEMIQKLLSWIKDHAQVSVLIFRPILFPYESLHLSRLIATSWLARFLWPKPVWLEGKRSQRVLARKLPTARSNISSWGSVSIRNKIVIVWGWCHIW